MKDGEKGVDEAGVGKLESGGGEFGGVGAGAGEEGFIGHFAEGESEGEGGDGKNGGAMEVGGKDAGELSVGDRVGGGEVDGAGEGGGFEEEEDGGESVGEGDPADELSAASEPAAEAETKDGEEARQGSAGAGGEDGAENDAEAKMEDTDAGLDGRLGGGFPLLTDIGEKAGAEAGGFVEELVTAIAIDADGRGDEEHLGGMAETGKDCGQGASGSDAAIGDFVLVFGGPAMGGEVCAGEVDGGGKVFKTLGVRDGGGGGWIPLELVGQGWGAPNELEDREVSFGEGVMKRRAEHAGGAGKEEPGHWGRCIDGTDVAFLLMNTIASNW